MAPYSITFVSSSSEYEIRNILASLQLGILHRIEFVTLDKIQYVTVHYASFTNSSILDQLNEAETLRYHGKGMPVRLYTSHGYWNVYKAL